VVKVVQWLNSDLQRTHRVDSYFFAEWPVELPLSRVGIELREYWTKWFGTSRSGEPKGIVVVRLGAGMP
jgi:hypothetical protein